MKVMAFALAITAGCTGHDVLNPTCGNVGANQCYAVPGVTPGVSADESSYYLEEYRRAAGIGVCKTGIPTCDNDYNVIACDGEGPLPSNEVCDLLDNDCNGMTDEGWDGEPLIAHGKDDTCGEFGACAGYNAVCTNGVYVCPYDPQPEECDGVDNDCDARVDEDVFDSWTIGQRACYSGNPLETAAIPPCRAGLLECLYGEVICLNEITPSIERCDEVDNDCNGATDDTGDVLSTNYDIVFIVDTSGSMCDEIAAVAGACSAYTEQFDSNPYFRFALVLMSADTGELVQVDTDFTDFSNIRDRLLNLGCYGSGAEASLDSMEMVCNKTDNQLGLSWRDDANGLFFAFTDEPQQSYTDPPTTAQMVIDSCINSGVLPFIWSMYSIQFQYIAQGGNGQHFTLVDDWETILANLNSIIITLCGADD